MVGLGQGTRVGGRSPHPHVDGGGAGLTTHPGPHAPWGWPLRRLGKDGPGVGGVLQGCWGRGVCRAPREELQPGVGSQVADQAKLHPPPGGCGTGREPSSKGMNSGGGWGLPWPQVPPRCLSKEGIEGPPVLTTSLLAPVPQKAGWGASSVSRHSFSGAGCSFPGQHSAVMELGGQVWR